MLVELENELVQLIKSSPLNSFIKEVDVMPSLDGDSLVKKFNTAAPAIYVAHESFPISINGLAIPRFGIALIVKNASGQKAARQGDGKVIGLNQMIDGVLSIFNSANTSSCSWMPSGVDFIREDVLFANGLWMAVVKVGGTEVSIPAQNDVATLADFTRFHADLDVPPFVSGSTQAEWSQQNYSHGTPKAQDDVPLST